MKTSKVLSNYAQADDLSDDDAEEMEGMGGMGRLGDELRSLTEQDA